MILRKASAQDEQLAPGHVEHGDPLVKGLLLHHPVSLLVDAAPGSGDARMLVRPIGLVV